MNKIWGFLFCVLVLCFIVGFLIDNNAIGYENSHIMVHGKRLKEEFAKAFHQYLHGNRINVSDVNTTRLNVSQTGIFHKALRILGDKLDVKKLLEESEKLNVTTPKLFSGYRERVNPSKHFNISQTEFEINTEVLKTFQGKLDLRQLREKAAKANSTRRKVVLMYTPFIDWLTKNEEFNTILGTKCPFFQCEFTTDKKDLNRSDAAIFHARDMPGIAELRNIQKIRPSHQRWIYFILENPIYTSDPTPFNGMFNWTLTYKTDSDLRIRYGNYFERTTPWTEQESLKKLVGKKTKLAFWAASHCNLLRDKYVRKLKKYVNVDVFGACGAALGGGSGSCGRFSQDCQEKMQQYKFALAFENQMCKDYITEKYWDKLLENVVPVVMGGSTYNSEVAVPGSFINAADFPTVKELANYLLYLDKNNTAYMKYFEWKKKYVVRRTLAYFRCALCAKLNLDHEPKVYKKLNDFWSRSKHCGLTDKIFKDIINKS